MPSSSWIPVAQAMQRHSGGWKQTPRAERENAARGVGAAGAVPNGVIDPSTVEDKSGEAPAFPRAQ
jgi:hypothetical protein